MLRNVLPAIIACTIIVAPAGGQEGFSSAVEPSQGLPDWENVLEAPVTAGIFCVNCVDSGCGPWAGHVVQSAPLSDYGPPDHWPMCGGGTCDMKHGTCIEVRSDVDEAVGQVDAVRAALLGGDHEAVVRLIAQGSEWLSYNLERSAVQVHGCGGEVSAHFPVRDEELADALASITE